MSYREGQTALVLPVAEADRVLDHWRTRYDPSAAGGMPAHIKVMAPYLDASQIGPQEHDTLSQLFAGHPAMTIEFRAFGTFPAVLYLDPFPHEPIRELIDTVGANWPGTPSSDGELDVAIPHLTIAAGIDTVTATMIEGDLAERLPVRAKLERAALMGFDGLRWRELASFALAS